MKAVMSTRRRLVRPQGKRGQLAAARTLEKLRSIEGALQVSEQRYRELVEHAPIGIYRSTREGRFLNANRAFAKMLGYDANKEVLSSAISVDSIGGFYAIGATRITLLDTLVALALLIGVGVPVVHLTLTWLFRRYAKRIGGREDS